MPDEAKTPCATCRGSAQVTKKVWAQPNVKGVHPAIAAGARAYRTTVSSPCPDCHEGKEASKRAHLEELARRAAK